MRRTGKEWAWEEQGVGDVGREGSEDVKREVDETGLKLSITEGGKEGKRQVISSCSYLKERFQECSNQRRSGYGDECRNAWRRLEKKRTQQLKRKKKRGGKILM